MKLMVEDKEALNNVKCVCRGDGDMMISDCFFNMANITLQPFGSEVTCVAEINNVLRIVWVDHMYEEHEYTAPLIFKFYNDNGIYFYIDGKPVIGVLVLKVLEMKSE